MILKNISQLRGHQENIRKAHIFSLTLIKTLRGQIQRKGTFERESIFVFLCFLRIKIPPQI
jgi:hypothetical protein